MPSRRELPLRSGRIGMLLLALALLAPGCATRQAPAASAIPPVQWLSKLDAENPIVGQIWDVAAGRRIDEAELRARLQVADTVLLGETHDNPDHHRLQARLVDAYGATHPSPAVVFEMLDAEQQPAVDAGLQSHPGDADALARAVDWASSGWPEWSMYRPVFEAALAAHGPILAAGLNRAAAMRVAHDGAAALDPHLVQAFGLDQPLPAGLQAAMRREMSDVHCGMLPESMLDSMVLVQRARDALLAQRLHEGVQTHRAAILIAGEGHVRRDCGVPAQLERAYGARSVAVGFIAATADATTPESYAKEFGAGALPFDFVWFTPRANDVDHCAELRKHMTVVFPRSEPASWGDANAPSVVSRGSSAGKRSPGRHLLRRRRWELAGHRLRRRHGRPGGRDDDPGRRG